LTLSFSPLTCDDVSVGALADVDTTVGDALDNALFVSTSGLFKTKAINDGGPTWADRRAVEWQVPAGSTGTTTTGSTPPSGTCPRLSSNTVTGRLGP
jgi:hypothetical protein